MLVRLDRKRIKMLLGGLLAAALVILAGTAAHWLYGRQGAPQAVAAFTYQFDLTMENVVATWFSSMLLLVAGLAAWLCHAAAGHESKAGGARMRDGWLALAAGFVLLSLDEAASLHERIARNEFVLDLAMQFWPVFLAVPIYLIAFGWHQLRRSPRAFAMLAVGVALLTSVPLQEYIEEITWEQPGQPQRPLPMILLEEGSELAGGLLCLSALLSYAFYIARRRARWMGDGPALVVPLRRPRAGLIAAGLGLLGAAYAASFLMADPDPNVGTLSNWPPAALALIAALLAFRARRLWAGAVCLAVSVFVGAELYAVTGPAHPLRLLGIAAALFAAMRSAAAAPSSRRALYAAWGALCALAFAASGPVPAGWAALLAHAALAAALLVRLRTQAREPGPEMAGGPGAIGLNWGAGRTAAAAARDVERHGRAAE